MIMKSLSMSSINQTLFYRLRQALLKCDEFQNPSVLPALMADERLALWQANLPGADSLGGRVDLVIDYLVKKEHVNGENALVLLLRVLAERRSPQDKLQRELLILSTEINENLHAHPIYFIVAAMKQEEAEALIAGTIFGDYCDTRKGDPELFEEFKRKMHEHDYDLKSILTHYGEKRDDWQPLCLGTSSVSSSNKSACEMIETALQHSQSCFPRSIRNFYIESLSEEFFSEDRRTRGETADKLNSGGILLIDAISMFHPEFRDRFKNSEISSNRRMAILVVSPLNAHKLPLNNYIVDALEVRLEKLFDRFDRKMDRLCEVGVGDLRGLRRWLVFALEDVNRQRKIPDPDNRRRMEQISPQEPTGVYAAISSPRGVW
jgi:hypothetical protein